MPNAPTEPAAHLAPFNDALQHGPRPLPAFLAMLRREMGDDPAAMAAVLAGVRLFQRAPRPAPAPPMAEVARVGGACLRDYGGDGRTIVMVPSPINPASILDLDADRSLVRWLAGQGLRVLMVDWGHPRGGERRNVTGHVADLLLPMLRSLPEPPAIAGYCLGGTMAIAAARLMPVAGLALIAAPWHFAAYPPEARQGLAALWQQAGPLSAALGLLPMDVLQLAFWAIDPLRTLLKYAEFGRATDADRVRDFVTLEDWANGGAPLTHGAAREIMEDFFTADLPGRGAWTVDGVPVNPAALTCPAVQFASTTDRLVPLASCARLGERRDTSAGHVGMVVGRSARAGLWQPLRDWAHALGG